MTHFEQRIHQLEEKIESKCDKDDVKRIIKKNIIMEPDTEEHKDEEEAMKTQRDKPKDLEATVMTEINDRKARENNFIIYGLDEIVSESREARTKHDTSKVLEIAKVCDTNLQAANITQMKRLGRYSKPYLRRNAKKASACHSWCKRKHKIYLQKLS